ncbi:MAG: phosphopantothenoylcysteine decarboxylase [Endomicrobia bacterium]|nr:phosphopantothenoylcysteine decarboxylase [Endomicrobiia bacterium]
MVIKKVLVTAGPTLEYIDPIRYISNFSSGKIGYEIAKIFSKRFKTILVTGPTNLPTPRNAKVYKIKTAVEMFNRVKKFFNNCDIFISAAAVCDYKPEKMLKQKLKKTSGILKLRLKKTPDILRYCGKKKNKNQILVGFSLETDRRKAIIYAKDKLKDKNLDLIILNSPRTFQSDYISPVFIFKNGDIIKFSRINKSKFAKILYFYINKLLKYEKKN